MCSGSVLRDLPVLMICEEEKMYIAVSQNLLINESSVFRAEFSCNWQKNRPGNPTSGLSLRLFFALDRVLAFHLRSDKSNWFL